MITLQKRLTLLIFLIVGIATTSVASINPIETINNDTQSFEALVSDALDKADEKLMLSSTSEEYRLYKIYNTDNKLVYESRDADDERLKCFLKRSDLLMTTDSSSYYYLAE